MVMWDPAPFLLTWEDSPPWLDSTNAFRRLGQTRFQAEHPGKGSTAPFSKRTTGEPYGLPWSLNGASASFLPRCRRMYTWVQGFWLGCILDLPGRCKAHREVALRKAPEKGTMAKSSNATSILETNAGKAELHSEFGSPFIGPPPLLRDRTPCPPGDSVRRRGTQWAIPGLPCWDWL